MKYIIILCFSGGVIGLFQGGRGFVLYLLAASPLIAYVVDILFNQAKKKISYTIAERQEEKDFQKNLRREAERERVLSRARNEASIELIRENTNSLIAQARAGAHIEAELHAKRKELIAYENEEFDDLVKKIDKYL